MDTTLDKNESTLKPLITDTVSTHRLVIEDREELVALINGTLRITCSDGTPVAVPEYAQVTVYPSNEQQMPEPFSLNEDGARITLSWETRTKEPRS